MNLEIVKMVTLSTWHVTSESYHKLFEDKIDSLVSFPKGTTDGYEYGVFVYIPEVCGEDSLPQDIMKCVEFARENECKWIMFDCDAYTIAELPIYEW